MRSTRAWSLCSRRAPSVSWLFLLWNSRDDAPAVERVRETQRLALAREAAFRNATVHLFTEVDSSIVDDIQVDFT